MNKLQEIIERIESQNKSNIESAKIYCEIYSDDAHLCIDFTLASGDRKNAVMKVIYGENITVDDEYLIEEYNDFVNKYSSLLTTYYNIDCDVLGCYYI